MTQEEREKALALLRHVPFTVDPQQWAGAAKLLRDCVPVPRDELMRYKRALLILLEMPPNNMATLKFLQDAGLVEYNTGMPPAGRKWRWTDAANAFAADMEKHP